MVEDFGAPDVASRKSILERMAANFSFNVSAGANTLISVEGVLSTRDELDAACEVLAIMREWLPDHA